MNQSESLVPISVVAAIALFIVREILEAIRRSRADSRKKKALRIMLARECELNMWVYKRLLQILINIKEDFDNEVDVNYTIQKPPAGAPTFKREGKNGLYSISGFPDVQTSVTEKLMMDVASQDRKLFVKLESVYDELIDMRHVRDSIIRLTSSSDNFERMFFGSFPEYALAEIEPLPAALTALYKECTGKIEVPHRLR